jgi:hypothetical protein
LKGFWSFTVSSFALMVAHKYLNYFLNFAKFLFLVILFSSDRHVKYYMYIYIYFFFISKSIYKAFTRKIKQWCILKGYSNCKVLHRYSWYQVLRPNYSFVKHNLIKITLLTCSPSPDMSRRGRSEVTSLQVTW